MRKASDAVILCSQARAGLQGGTDEGEGEAVRPAGEDRHRE